MRPLTDIELPAGNHCRRNAPRPSTAELQEGEMKKKERIDRILALRREGKTLAEIGEQVSLTRERVRQICAQFEVSPPPKENRLIEKRERKPRRLLFDAIRRSAIDSFGRDPYEDFINHKSGSKARGIEFKLTFSEWWELWQPYFHNRGKRADQFCMCRYMDKGAYEIGNVLIKTQKENAQEQALVRKTRYYFRKGWAKRSGANLSSYHETVMGENEV